MTCETLAEAVTRLSAALKIETLAKKEAIALRDEAAQAAVQSIREREEAVERSVRWMQALGERTDELRLAEAQLGEAVEKYHQIAPGHKGWKVRDCPNEYCRSTLAGLSTVTPDCERVSVPVPCESCTLPHRYVERCAYHGCDWPDGEKECPSQGGG